MQTAPLRRLSTRRSISHFLVQLRSRARRSPRGSTCFISQTRIAEGKYSRFRAPTAKKCTRMYSRCQLSAQRLLTKPRSDSWRPHPDRQRSSARCRTSVNVRAASSIYPREQALRIAKATNAAVLTTKASTTKAVDVKSGNLARVSPSGQDTEFAENSATNEPAGRLQRDTPVAETPVATSDVAGTGWTDHSRAKQPAKDREQYANAADARVGVPGSRFCSPSFAGRLRPATRLPDERRDTPGARARRRHVAVREGSCAPLSLWD